MPSATRGSWGAEAALQLADVGLPLVEVPTEIGLSLVLKWPSGCAYFNQTGGHACLQSWAEGLLVPLAGASTSTEERLYELFGSRSSKYGGHCSREIDELDARHIDALLAAHHRAFAGQQIIRVDRARLADSHEAWVHVVIAPHPTRPARLPLAMGALEDGHAFFWPFFGLPSSEAVLTWNNSD